MDVAKILVELRQEREQIEEAILSLELLGSEAVDAGADGHHHGWPRSPQSDAAVRRAVRTKLLPSLWEPPISG